MTKQRPQFGCGYPQTAQELQNHRYQTATTAELPLLLKCANSIVFATFVQWAWCTSR